MGTFKKMNEGTISVLQFASGDLWGGAEAQLHSLCKQLNKAPKLELAVVLLNKGELYEKLCSDNIKVHVFDEKELSAVQIFLKLNAFTKSITPHIIHTHRDKENVIGAVIARLNSIKSIRTVHGAPEHKVTWKKPHRKVIELLNRWSGQFLQQRIVSVSEELSSRLSKEFSKHKVDVIENGVDIEELDIFSRNSNLRYKAPRVNIGIIGRLVPVKRVDRFIQAASIINNPISNQQVSFHIFGDGPLYQELDESVSRLGISERIQFHGHCKEIHKKLANLDLLVMTSDHEGLPMTLLESMCLGTPTLCSAVGAIPKVLEEGNLGSLVKNLDAETFATAIEQIIKNKESAIEKAIKAAERVRVYYSSEQNAYKFINLYSQVTGISYKNCNKSIKGYS